MMTRKTQKAYEHALNYVNQHVFSLQCESIVTDYEAAMRQAIRKVVPGVQLLGCWFHYAQSIRRKVASLSELFELVRKNEQIRNIYYKIICLPLLPHQHIEKAFNELALEGLKLTKAFTPFVKYFQNQWLKRVGAENFSVFLQETRTTCAAEGYNGKLGKKFQIHPNFFTFIESLQWEEMTKSNALEQHISGARQTQPKREYRERATQIRNESMKFTVPNQTNAKLFLNRMANLKNRMLPQIFERFEDIVPYQDDEEVLDCEIDLPKNSTATKENIPKNIATKSNQTEEKTLTISQATKLKNKKASNISKNTTATKKKIPENQNQTQTTTTTENIATKSNKTEENKLTKSQTTKSKNTENMPEKRITRSQSKRIAIGSS